MIAIAKLLVLFLVLALVAVTALAASVGKPPAASDVENTAVIRPQRHLQTPKNTMCIYADVSKTGKKGIVCGDPAPPTLMLAKSSNAATSPPAPALPQPPLAPQLPQPLVTEQANRPGQQARTFLNLDCLKKPDPVNVYVQPQQQVVPHPQYVQPQVHYVQPQIHVDQPQVHYVQPQIHVEQPQVHYVQQPPPQVQYQPVVYQRPLCQPTEQCQSGYASGGYYGRSIDHLDYPVPFMKSIETGDQAQAGEDFVEQSAYAPAALYSDPAAQYGSGPTVAAMAYEEAVLAANRKGFGGSRMSHLPMMRPTPLFTPMLRNDGGDMQYFEAPVPAPSVPVMMMRVSDGQLADPNQRFSYIIRPVTTQQNPYNGLMRTADVQEQQQPALNDSVPESTGFDQVPAVNQSELKDAQESPENQQPADDGQSTKSSDLQKDTKAIADQKKTGAAKASRN